MPDLSSLLLFVTLSLSAVSNAQRLFNITNNCPIDIPLYHQGTLRTTLTTIQNDPQNSFLAIREDTTGFFFSTANKGNVDGNGAFRAGFLDDYYYIVRDPTWVNTGMTITPNGRAPDNGWCEVAKCELPGCGLDEPNLQDAYTSPPRRMPPLGDTPPERPMYACPNLGDAGFTINFCPNGEIVNMQRGPYSINPVGQLGKCLQVPRDVPVQNGTPVQIGGCHGYSNEKWEILRGRAQIKFAGTSLCIDATTAPPPNGTGLKLWQCYDDLPAQMWYWDALNKNIWLHNTGQCVDLTDGDLTNGRQTQVWQCSSGNPNQLWQVNRLKV